MYNDVMGMMKAMDDVTFIFTEMNPITFFISQQECDNLGRQFYELLST